MYCCDNAEEQRVKTRATNGQGILKNRKRIKEEYQSIDLEQILFFFYFSNATQEEVCLRTGSLWFFQCMGIVKCIDKLYIWG